MLLHHLVDKLRALTCCLLLFSAGGAVALDPSRPVSEYTVTAWTMEEGLPHNFVQALEQDRDGYLWIGSWAGATRFNGRDFTTFDGREAPGISLRGVRRIFADDDGSMLFGTAQHGIMRLSGGVWSTIPQTQQPRLHVLSLTRSEDGALWVGSDNTAWRLRPDGHMEDMKDLGLPRGAVFALLDTGDGHMLIGTEHGLYRAGGDRVESLDEQLGMAPTQVRALLRRSDGRLIVGSNNGAFQLRGEAPALSLYDQSVEALLEDRDGALWMSLSAGGLVRHHRGVVELLDRPFTMLGRGSQALMEDREGLLWVGTTNGLYRIADTPAFGLDASRGLGDNYPRTILNHTDGTMYVGHSGGLDHWVDDRFEDIPLESLNSSVLALANARDGGLWIGTYDRGVLHRQADGRLDKTPLSMANGLPANHIRALLETDDGSLWIGTTNGLARRRPDGSIGVVKGIPEAPDGFVRGLSPSSDGGVWVALANGLMRQRTDESFDHWTPETEFPGLGSFDVLDTGNGDVLIGSDRGLVRRRNGRFTLYDRDHGLPNETLFRLLFDAQGMLWACSNHGVFRIDPAQLDEIDAGTRSRLSVDVLDHDSGMPSSQCNGGSGPAGRASIPMAACGFPPRWAWP